MWLLAKSEPLLNVKIFQNYLAASRNVSDWWLSYWVSHSQNGTISKHTNSSPTDFMSVEPASDNLAFYLGIYGGLAFSNSVCDLMLSRVLLPILFIIYKVFTLFRAFLYAYGGIQAAKTIHKKLLSAMLKAPVCFFDVTPVSMNW